MVSVSFLFCTGQAHASGGWLLTDTATGSSHTSPSGPPVQPYSASGSGTNSGAVSPVYTSGFGVPGGVSTSLSVTVTVTGKWQGSDPAPPSVKVVETAMLDQNGQNGDGFLASGTLTDPWGDPTVNTTVGNQPDAICQTPGSTPIQHLSTQSGSSFTLTRTFSATSEATSTPPQACSAAAHFDSYTVSIHAQPYAFMRSTILGSNPPVTVSKGQGTLGFQYTWLSTSGSIADLTSCQLREYVTYDTSKNVTQNGMVYYAADDPPFPWLIPNLTDDVLIPGTDGKMQDNQGYESDGNGNPAFSKPYKSDFFDGTQIYQFNDSATMAAGTWQQVVGPSSGPFTIHRNFTQDNSTSPFYFTVSKDGEMSSKLYEF